MPGRSLIVQTRKSSDTSGIAAAVQRLDLERPRQVVVAVQVSKMWAVTTREYRSVSGAGSKPVSATSNA